jgi:hypothetical protein
MLEQVAVPNLTHDGFVAEELEVRIIGRCRDCL